MEGLFAQLLCQVPVLVTRRDRTTAELADGTVYKAVGVAAVGIEYLRKYLFAICVSLSQIVKRDGTYTAPAACTACRYNTRCQRKCVTNTC